MIRIPSLPCAVLALAVASTLAAETLPSGIELPAEWPPRSRDEKSREVMPVPYLQSPPAVIRIDVGRQLFVDDFLIEQTDLTRTFHLAKKLESNPVFKPTTVDEIGPADGNRAVCYLGHGGVFYDPFAKLFRMWYTADWRGGLATATSRDALAWERPNLGLAGNNLILARDSPHVGGDNSVWFDTLAKNPDERVKFLADHTGKRKSHFVSTIARDGRVLGETPAGKAGDYCSIFYNPFRGVWVYSIKRDVPGLGRARHYAESREFLTPQVFDRSVFWVNADKLDKGDPRIGDTPQLYSLSAVAYESIMLGAFQIHLGPRNSICELGLFPKITELKLGFSRDGFHWDRPDRRAFIGPTRKDGDWDRGYVHTTTGVCLVVGDQLYFPFTAYSGTAPDGHRGMYTGASVGMAVLRRDGFASMDAKNTVGTLTTRPVQFDGRRLFVNAATAGGELRVEVLDDKGNVIPGFSKAESTAVSDDRTLAPVTWKGSELGALRGRTVKFRFHVARGSLYAFWVSPDESGASRGYVAAGGPGYDGVVDTVGAAAWRASR
jgi:hypothetical protein